MTRLSVCCMCLDHGESTFVVFISHITLMFTLNGQVIPYLPQPQPLIYRLVSDNVNGEGIGS